MNTFGKVMRMRTCSPPILIINRLLSKTRSSIDTKVSIAPASRYLYSLRTFSTLSDELLADRRRLPKSDKFYADEGLSRRYYYVTDTRGHLFLESARVRVYATCLRDKKFLNFFYRMLQRNTTSNNQEFPYISMCGRETNYLTPEDPLSSIVFLGLDEQQENLTYGCGSMLEPFVPSALSWSHQTHRIYHPLLKHSKLGPEVGLVHPVLAELISSNITWDDTTLPGTSPKHILRWKDNDYILRVLEDDSSNKGSIEDSS